MTDEPVTRPFFAALNPILRRVSAERTLSPGKMGILRHLSDHGRATAAELAATGRTTPQGISLAARELERLLFVVRVPDSEDRRRIWIELTELGRKKLAQESAAGYDWVDRAIRERLTPQEWRTLEAAIPALVKIDSEAPVA